ncbi:LivJ protein [Escherichia coli P12b]|nr:LivJ protein [Escherichia coli P12b]
MQHFELARFCRPDKAFTPHPAFCARGWLYHRVKPTKRPALI